jgi:hypothetical protein
MAARHGSALDQLPVVRAGDIMADPHCLARRTLQIDADELHDGKHDCEGQRYGQRDDGAGPRAEAHDAHRHDDGDRLPQRLHELADRALDDGRLIRHQRRLDAEGRVLVAAETNVGHHARDHHDQPAIHHEGAVLERPSGKVELRHRAGPSRRTFWPGWSAWAPAVTTISPVSSPFEIATVAGLWRNVDVSQRYGHGLGIDHPQSGATVDFGQRRGGNLDRRGGVDLHAPGDGRTEAHGGRWIGQADLDLERPGHGIGLRGDLAHAPDGRHGRVVRQADVDNRFTRGRPQHLAGTSKTASRRPSGPRE